MTFLMIYFVCACLVLAALSIPLIRHKVGPNALYGFRVPQTLEDPTLWYPVNAFFAKGLLGIALATGATAALLYLVPQIEVGLYGSLVAGVLLLGLAIDLFLSFRYLARLAEQKQKRDS